MFIFWTTTSALNSAIVQTAPRPRTPKEVVVPPESKGYTPQITGGSIPNQRVTPPHNCNVTKPTKRIEMHK